MDDLIKLGIGITSATLGWLLGWGKDWLNKRAAKKSLIEELSDIKNHIADARRITTGAIKNNFPDKVSFITPMRIEHPIFDTFYPVCFYKFSAHQRSVIRYFMMEIDSFNGLVTMAPEMAKPKNLKLLDAKLLNLLIKCDYINFLGSQLNNPKTHNTIGRFEPRSEETKKLHERAKKEFKAIVQSRQEKLKQGFSALEEAREKIY